MSALPLIDLKPVLGAISRGNGRFAFGRSVSGGPARSPFCLAVGAANAIEVPRGFISIVGMTREHLKELYRDIGKALAETEGS